MRRAAMKQLDVLQQIKGFSDAFLPAQNFRG
jgi:hypothetical protein